MEGNLQVRSATALRNALLRLERRGYKAYQALLGAYDFEHFRLIVDHVQSDPYASPSHLRVQVPVAVHEIPRDLYRDRIRRIALEDCLVREFARALADHVSRPRRRVIGGTIGIDEGAQEVLDRSASRITPERVEIRFVAGLPAEGRSIAGAEAARLLCDDLPRVVARALLYRNLPRERLRRFVETVEDQVYLRRQLPDAGLVAFVANGAILPRRSGVDDHPLPAARAVPFQSPPSLEVTLEAPNAGPVTGMGVPAGVTLIVGGGFHGKSTLLAAIERSVYDHVPGDGREQVVAVRSAVKIRAEDGRYVSNVDISDFIGVLPGGIDTRHFSSENASGSTSQATNIVEALEIGATCLLMDEDTCATNFMIRDERMQALVATDKEPIIPFLDRVWGLHRVWGVSTILVMGGVGDYFEVADTVIMMDGWRAVDRTADARRIATEIASGRRDEGPEPIAAIQRRVPYVESIDPSRGRRAVKIATRAHDRMVFGTVEIDLAAVSQLVDISQTRAIGELLVHLKERIAGASGELSLADHLEALFRELDREGLDMISSRPVGYLAAPRRFEVAAALNRLRGVKMKQLEGRMRRASA
jgi:predicted ABC-class ATPase